MRVSNFYILHSGAVVNTAWRGPLIDEGQKTPFLLIISSHVLSVNGVWRAGLAGGVFTKLTPRLISASISLSGLPPFSTPIPPPPVSTLFLYAPPGRSPPPPPGHTIASRAHFYTRSRQPPHHICQFFDGLHPMNQ